MPAVLSFALDLYFATVLGVSGLAKIDDPVHFALTLRQQRLLPEWSITGISYSLPWAEFLLAAALVLGVAPLLTGTLVLALFGVFLAVEVIVLSTGRTTSCGCFGRTHNRPVDAASVIVSVVLVLFAVFHLWAVYVSASSAIQWTWRIPAILLFSAGVAWLLGHVIRRHQTMTVQEVSVKR